MANPSYSIILLILLATHFQLASAQEKSLTTLAEEARQFVEVGKTPEAEKTYLATLRLYEKELAVDSADEQKIQGYCQTRTQLAHAQFSMWKLDDAVKVSEGTCVYLRQLIKRRPDAPVFALELASALQAHASGLRHLLRHCDAEPMQKEALAVLRQACSAHPARTDVRIQLLKTLQSHAALLMDLARYPEAEVSFQEAVRAARQLCDDHPKEMAHFREYAMCYNSYSFLVRESGRFAEAIDMMRDAVRILTPIEKAYPNQPEFWYMLPVIHRNSTQPLGYMHRQAEIETANREAARVDEKLKKMPEATRKLVNDHQRVASSLISGNLNLLLTLKDEVTQLNKDAEARLHQAMDSPYALTFLAASKGIRGNQAVAQGLTGDALRDLLEAKEILDKVCARWPALLPQREMMGELEISCGLLKMRNFEVEDGKKWIRSGIDRMSKVAADAGNAPRMRWKVADKLATTGMVIQALHGHRAALPYYNEGFAIINKLAENYPTCSLYRRHIADWHSTMSGMHFLLGDHDEAIRTAKRGIEAWEKVLADFPTVEVFRESLGKNHGLVAVHLVRTEKYAQAEASFAECEKILRVVCERNPKQATFHATLARNLVWAAVMYERQDRYADAVIVHTKMIQALETALALNPRQRGWLEPLKVSIDHRAFHYLKLGKHAEYFREQARAKEMAELLDSPFVRLPRIDDRIKRGESSQALKEAEDLFLHVELSASDWRSLAGAYVKLSQTTKDAAQQALFTQRAIESLRNAVDRGCLPAELRTDSAFAPLVQNADFRTLTEK